ncbi:MAG: class I SAM-dependent methyltransferase [Thermoplasmata archaeon]
MSRRTARSPEAAPPYALTARIYDAIYDWKDYEGDARRIHQLVATYGPPHPRTLLDVACGTGSHLVYLSRSFESTGLDLNPRMLRIARRKLPQVTFVNGRMEEFRLGRKFDVITCLFSAVAYVRNEGALRRTLRTFADHLNPGGIAIVEPFIEPSKYRVGAIHAQVYGPPDLPVARMNLSERRGDRSIMVMHHLVGTPNGVRHWVERHDLGLFSAATYLAAFRAAGFRARYLSKGFMKERGLVIGVIPPERARVPTIR